MSKGLVLGKVSEDFDKPDSKVQDGFSHLIHEQEEERCEQAPRL
jgi:hypothetical protein